MIQLVADKRWWWNVANISTWHLFTESIDMDQPVGSDAIWMIGSYQATKRSTIGRLQCEQTTYVHNYGLSSQNYDCKLNETNDGDSGESISLTLSLLETYSFEAFKKVHQTNERTKVHFSELKLEQGMGNAHKLANTQLLASEQSNWNLWRNKNDSSTKRGRNRVRERLNTMNWWKQ